MGSISTRNFEGIALGPALPLIGSNSYSVLLVADNGGGTQQHLHALIVNGVGAPSPMAQWRQGFWGTTAATDLSADDADPDGDGLLNAIEYGLGGDPTVAGQSPLPRLGTGSGNLALTLNRNVTNTDLTITVQATDALTESWTDLAQSVNGAPMTALVAGVIVTETGTGAIRSVEVRDLYAIGNTNHPRRFMRVKVTTPGPGGG